MKYYDINVAHKDNEWVQQDEDGTEIASGTGHYLVSLFKRVIAIEKHLGINEND